jgi:cytochrome c oxidase subunit 2
MDQIPFWPDQASNFAGPVDALYITLIVMSAVFTIPIVGLIIYFGVKYRRGSSAVRTGGRPGHWLEWGWIGGLFVLVVPVYFWATSIYMDMFRPPANPIDIYVVGKQWMWKTQHLNGKREIDQLHVPIDRPVRLIMTSEDVIHSFYVPAFRIKHDVIPGRYTTLWFVPTKIGSYHLFCAEYCGTDHALMGGQVVVMSQADYQTWLNQSTTTLAGQVGTTGATANTGLAGAQPPNTQGAAESQGPGQLAAGTSGLTPGSMVQTGALLFDKAGCISCHHMDGTGVGPSLVGVYNSQVQLQGGGVVLADENYIHESIVAPNAKIVSGYQPVMPSFTGQFSEEELMSVVAFVKSLSPASDTSK